MKGPLRVSEATCEHVAKRGHMMHEHKFALMKRNSIPAPITKPSEQGTMYRWMPMGLAERC